MVPNSVGPRYLYGTDTAEAFANAFASRKPDALPIYIHDIGTEGLRFPINPGQMVSVQFAAHPETKAPEVWITVTVDEDTLTGHPGFRVVISVPYDASVAYTYPEDAI